MDNKDNKKKRKKTEEGGEEKVHKQNWRETHASTEDIQKFLSEHVLLRHNTVTGQSEFRVPERDEFDSLGMKYLTGATPLDEWRSATDWQTVNMQNLLSFAKDVRDKDFWRVINSDYVALFDPFRRYLDGLPPWDGKTNPIMELSSTVMVKGGAEEQLLFYACLRKWLVAMIAGWLDDDVVNQEILVLVGRLRLPAQMARGDDRGLARRRRGESGDPRTRGTPGDLQDDLVQCAPAPGIEDVLPLEHQLRQHDEGRGAEALNVRSDLLRGARHDEALGDEPPEMGGHNHRHRRAAGLRPLR